MGARTGGPWTATGAGLLLLAAVAQIAYGVAAIGGYDPLEDNVRQIESRSQFGELYLSLGGWGVILVLVGIAELWAASSLARRRRHGRLAGLCAALFGLGVAFFTLALFRVAAIATMGILVAALYVLSYRVGD